MINDPIADLLTRVRNGQRAGHRSVRVRHSKMAVRILNVLKDEGFVDYFEDKKNEESGFNEIVVGLKYDSNGAPLIESLRRESRCGRRKYVGAADVPQVHCGLGIAILSTSQGVMSDRQARQKSIGGELLATVS